MENITVIIPFFNGHRTIGRLLDSLPEASPVIVVDDMSDSPLHLNNRNVTLLAMEEKGYFAGAVNLGIEECDTDVLVLNQDVWFEDTRWIDFIEENRERYAVLGDGVFGHPAWTKGYVQGTFMFMRRDAIDKVGLLEAEHYPLWGGTCEWQLRACRQGFEALPIKPVPGMKHERDDQKNRHYGSSIQTLLRREKGRREYFIRTPPMISVIVPCYNHGKYLEDLVNSLIGGPTPLGVASPQTFQSFEIILVDDASIDDSWEYIKALEDPWKGIRGIQHTVNGGTAVANNTGAKNSYGRYLTFISADDMMETQRLEKLYRVSLEYEGMVIYDDMKIFAQDRLSKVWPMRTYDFELLLSKNHIHAGIMIPRQAWEEVGGYPEVMNRGREDWAFNVLLGINGWCGHHINGYAGYLYRREGQNRTLRNTNPIARGRFLRQMTQLFPNIYAGERPMGCCGGRRNQPTRISKRRSPMALPGSDGLVLIEYVGGKHGIMTYYGPVTHARYTFGGQKIVGYVDAEDAIEMVAMRQNRKAIFKYFESKKRKVEPIKKKPEVIPVEKPEAVPVEDVQTKLRDPGDMTIAEIKEYVEDMDALDLQLLLEMEEEDRGRKGAIAAIEAALSVA